MDGLSAVAGVATAAVQLSKSLYDLYSTVRTSRYEIQDVANNVSLLAMVLEELDGVLCDDKLSYKPELREAAQSIALRCASIFNDIRKHTGTDRELKGEKFYEKVAWYFKRERVKPLRSSLESLKSTLNILLHVVQLAKSTKGVEEYPGVKSIGHWYVRRERRGLVWLVIDNRHATEKLKHLEQQKAQTNKDLVDNERPLTFADIFPLSTSNHKRGQSPERKFVVAFRNPACRSDDDSRRPQEPEIDFLQADPSTPRGDRFLLASSPGENRSPLELSSDSDVDTIGRSTSSQSARNSRMRTRLSDEQPTSGLIMNIIPHEEADLALKSAQNMSQSTLLEAKAEETIDILMRNWTYVDPEYFSEDDRSSISSLEPSFSLLRKKSPESSHEGGGMDQVEQAPSTHEGLMRQRSDLSGNTDPAKKFDEIQVALQDKGPEDPASIPIERGSNRKKRPNPLSPTAEKEKYGRGGKAENSSPKLNDRMPLSPKEPTTPAPPYPSSHPDQCSSCYAASRSEPRSYTDKSPNLPTMIRNADAEPANETSPPLDSFIKVFGTHFLEIMKQNSVPNFTLDARSRQESEQRENHQQPIAVDQETEPVILKDCLERRFLFPFQKCKSWQSMENLIKRSFCHVENMNSKIFRGSYDILSPTGEIILPEIWDSVITPGWVVELRFWDSSTGGESKEEDLAGGIIQTAPAILSSSTASPAVPSSDTQLAISKRRASLRTWLGNRKSTPSVALGR